MHQRQSVLTGARGFALALLLALPFAASASEVTDFATAKSTAAGAGKPILIDFSSPT